VANGDVVLRVLE